MSFVASTERMAYEPIVVGELSSLRCSLSRAEKTEIALCVRVEVGKYHINGRMAGRMAGGLASEGQTG